MKNIIDIDNNEITDKDALKHKNFNTVMEKYNQLKPPFYKSPFFGGGAVIITILIALFLYHQNKNSAKAILSNPSYSATYHSPINKTIAFETIKGVVNLDSNLTVITKSGSRINVPANTLVDSLGNFIAGDVTFKYRAFLDQKDLFLSGIPMNYDSTNSKMNFESGGMFELLAYQNNQPIFIAPKKTIRVALASKEIGNNFNIYYYQPKSKKWIYKKKDEAGFSKKEIAKVNELLFNFSVDSLPNDMLTVAKDKVFEQLQALQSKKSIQPKLADTSKYSFTINVDYRDFPELTSFKGLKFQVSNKEKNFKPEYAKETWNNVAISHGTNKNEYHICFTNQKQGEVCFLTNPVFAKSNIANAKVQYNKLLANYKQQKNALKKRNKAIRKEIAKRSRELNNQRRIDLNKRAVNLSTVVENRITRTFQIANFGIWNSDCPQKLPTEAIVKANFVDDNGNKMQFGTMYLVLKQRNEVISMSAKTIKEGIHFNPKEECMLWAVTSDRKNVAIVKSEQLNAIKDTDKSFTFEVNLISSSQFVSYSTATIFNL